MKLKLPLLLFAAAAAIPTAFSTFAATDAERAVVPLRYQHAGAASESVRKALGDGASGAVLSADLRENRILLDPSHREFEKVRAWLMANDLRPALAEVSMTVSETLEMKDGSLGKTITISKPRITGAYGEPMTITIGDKEKTLNIELTVKPIPGQTPEAK